jgi:hypothetical protein
VFALRACGGAPGRAVDFRLPAEFLGSPDLRGIAEGIVRALHLPVECVRWPERAGQVANQDRDERRLVS